MKPVSANVQPRNIAGSLSARLADVHHAIVSCERCPRLRTYCRTVAREKKRAYRLDTYWGRPVTGFGDLDARMLLVGLAPAAHGANRTGRVFTGDGIGGSADFLMSAEAQARKQDPAIWGDPTVLAVDRLGGEDRTRFDALPLGAATLAPADLGPTLPEPHPSWAGWLEAEWQRRTYR